MKNYHKFNKGEWAKKCGVSAPAVSKAVKKGVLTVGTDGLISMKDPYNLEYYEKHKVTVKKPPPKVRTRAKSSKQRQLGIPKSAKKIEEIETNRTKMDYDIERIKSQTVKIDIENAKKLGELIERRMVEAYFSNFATVFSNYILPQGQRLSKDIADIFGNSDPELLLKVQLLIDEENERAANEIVRVATQFRGTGDK